MSQKKDVPVIPDSAALTGALATIARAQLMRDHWRLFYAFGIVIGTLMLIFDSQMAGLLAMLNVSLGRAILMHVVLTFGAALVFILPLFLHSFMQDVYVGPGGSVMKVLQDPRIKDVLEIEKKGASLRAEREEIIALQEQGVVYLLADFQRRVLAFDQELAFVEVLLYREEIGSWKPQESARR